MRIISGHLKGRRIIAPKKLPVRPTTDMAKEGLFNILNHRIHFHDVEVLDLFAGIGSISFEFLSRGTQRVSAIDNHYECIKFLSKTAEVLNVELNTIKHDAFAFLEHTELQVDLIFADPPYDIPLEQFEYLVKLIQEKQLLNNEGLLIVEHSKHTNLEHLERFQEQRRYGNSVFSFFEF